MNKTIKGFIMGLLVGVFFMVSTSSLAGSIKDYVLVKSEYPIYVNKNLYESMDRPILNYEGHTYVPLRAIGELLGAGIKWDEKVRQVEITYGEQSLENQAFRNIEVSGTQGNYTITGEARVYEATFNYEISDGHVVFFQGFKTTSAGAPDWGTFTLEFNIPKGDLPVNGTLVLSLFEESADDGSIINELPIVLEIFP